MTFIASPYQPPFAGNNGEMDDNVLTLSRIPLTPDLLTNAGAEQGALAGWYATDGSPPAGAVTAETYFGEG
jgi:hypothetical protein